MSSAAAAKNYYRSADYYSTTPGEWLGKGAEMLGLTGATSPEQFDSLADNLDPRTGKDLTVGGSRENRRVGLDMTFNSTKSVGIARELAGPDNAGDPRIEQAHREAVAYTIGLVEKDMQARVRVGGANGNRTTGNLVAYRVTHRDTRISAEDGMPDMSLHDHVFVFNATFDSVEDKWKAAEIGQIKHDAPFYEAIFHNRLAANLKELGYGIRRKDKAFEIAGISDDLVKKFSRRRQYIKMVAEKLGITNPKIMAKLGATTRLGKTKELADDLNGYYVSRLTDVEKQQLTQLEGQPSYMSNEEKAVRYAIGHEFERKSVVEERKLYETAIRHGIGSVTVEGIQKEAKRQGVLLKGGDATTRSVLGEESRIIAFAREGRGTMKPLRALLAGLDTGYAAGPTIALGDRPDPNFDHSAVASGYSPAEGACPSTPQQRTDTATLPAFGQQKGRPDESKRPLLGLAENVGQLATLPAEQQAGNQTLQAERNNFTSALSPEQRRVAEHVWNSPDRVILIRGAAGTGKTHTMKTTIAGIDAPVADLAPSADASRGVLRREGFADADTVASFLGSPQRQRAVRNGVIWIDEAGLLPIRDLSRLTDIAAAQNARIVLQGDPKQHRAVARDGNMFHVLQKFAGIPVAELKDIRRQRGEYKDAVAAIDSGDILKAHDLLDDLGYVRQVSNNTQLVDDYLCATRSGKSVLVVAPTHKEGDEITAEIRTRLKAEGKLGDEKEFETLVSLGWSEAEKGDLARYQGDEVLHFFRNSGTFKAGDRVRVADWRPAMRFASAGHFAVYRGESVGLAPGDTIRITANGHDITKRHKLNNGALYTVKGFTEKGDVALTNGWVLGKDYGHLTHGYVSTSHAAQGKTVDRVLIAMGTESVRAMNAAQFYVSVSRGRESATIYTDMPSFQLREAIQRQDNRRSATEFIGNQSRVGALIARIKRTYALLRDHFADATREVTKERELQHGR